MIRLSALVAPAAAFAAGAVSVSGFGELVLFPVPVAAMTFLAWLWGRAGSVREAAWTGFAFGAGLFLVGVSWVYVSLHDFGMMPAPLAAIATLAFCLYLALFPALAGALQARLAASRTVRALLLLPALWTLTEWLRGWLFTGFPWLALGYSQVDGPLAGFLPVIGVYGVSFATCLVAGALSLLGPPRARSALGVSVALLVAAIGFGLFRAEWTTPEPKPVGVALLQGNVPQELKFVPGRFESTIETYAKLAEGAKARLIVMPETAVPRFLDQVSPAYLERLERIGQGSDGHVLVGAPYRDQSGYYNAVIALGASPPQIYAKSHLVPFGEFIPPGFGWVLKVLQIPMSDFSGGPADPKPMRVAGERVAVNVCYEDAFGEEIIRQLPDATLLANVSNVAWFGDSLAPEQHLRISRARALESGRYMLRATNTGVTAIIDERGRVLARLPGFTEGRLEGEARGFSGATPYVRVGNSAVLVLAIVTLIGGVLAGRRRRASDRRVAARA